MADPVVAPAFTSGLNETPNGVKIKHVTDNIVADDKDAAVRHIIEQKNATSENSYNDGATPRQYSDLVGSLCNLTSGSGDKGTPVIWIKGYFDDYTTE